MMAAQISTSTAMSSSDVQKEKNGRNATVDTSDTSSDIGSTNTSTANMGCGSDLDSRFSDEGCSSGSSSHTDDSEDDRWEAFLEHSFEAEVPVEYLAIWPKVSTKMLAWHLECLAEVARNKNTQPSASLSNSGKNDAMDNPKILISL